MHELRRAVEGAIRTFANGFLSHPENDALRASLANGDLSPTAFYQELLYLVYRLLFLMVAEERNLLTQPTDHQGDDPIPAADAWAAYGIYNISHLRALAFEPLSAFQCADDLYPGLQVLFRPPGGGEVAASRGVPAPSGELFGVAGTPNLGAAHLADRDLLIAVGQLSHGTPAGERVLRRVNYAGLDVERLGGIYESLLDEHPVILASVARCPRFDFIRGAERKTTGSYYTARELVEALLDSALDPVIANRLRVATEAAGSASGAAAHGAVQLARRQALLSLRVCDPACGSGHFLLAAVRRIGRCLAQVETGEDEPGPEAVRHWTREAILHCIYGVDKNPLAVGLCKVALWLEAGGMAQSLTLLDDHIRCGDSLVGVFDLKVLDEGIPENAYNPVAGDDNKVARQIRKRNMIEAARQVLAGVLAEQELHEPSEAENGAALEVCDLWTAAFFTPLTPANAAANLIPTTEAVRNHRHDPGASDARLLANVRVLAEAGRFFHWPLAFPEVFRRGGFDVILGNPPWERIKLQEQEFFATRDAEIAAAPNKAERQRLIDRLPQRRQALWQEFSAAKQLAESRSKFVRASGRYPLTAAGDVNAYALFAELARDLAPHGRAGMIVPTGIATDDTTREFFGGLIQKRAVDSLYDFENREALFPGVHRSYKFSLLTMSRAPVAQSQFVFFATRLEHLADPRRRYTLSPEAIALFNPNTRTLPAFRTTYDAQLTRKIYGLVPVLQHEREGANPWGLRFLTMFHMSNDSNLFKEHACPGCLRLYEGKMVQAFDHRAASVVTVLQNLKRPGQPVQTSIEQHRDPTYFPQPQYWVAHLEVRARLASASPDWLIGFKSVTSPTNERTFIATLLPLSAVGNSMPLMLVDSRRPELACCLLANLNSLVFDYVARQKVGGVNLNFFIVKQFPILPPAAYGPDALEYIAPRVVELVYTAWDMSPFVVELYKQVDKKLAKMLDKRAEAAYRAVGGHEWRPPGGENCAAPLAPFMWDEKRRSVIRAELDAYYARLYGLTRDEFRYILDPTDVCGPDFPGETFRVLKEKEERAYGEYRTQRLVLEAWDRLEDELGPVVVRNYVEEIARTG